MIRIASWPHWYHPNRYLPLFYDALETYGVEHLRNVPLQARALTDPDLHVSALHLHWPYAFWRTGGRGVVGQLQRVLKLDRVLQRVRASGVRILWTVHNLEHHEGDNIADRLARRRLVRWSNLQIFHSRWAREEFGRAHKGGDAKRLVMPHGNYDGALPAPAPIAATRQRLGIPADARLLLCFGQIRPYKGFEHAVAALRYLPVNRYRLIIAGRPVAGIGATSPGQRTGEPGVQWLLKELGDQELANLLEAADVVLLPYLKSSGSGALLHALTAGRPVITSDLPCFREVLELEPLAGAMVEPANGRALAAGIRTFFDGDLAPRRAAARALAERFEWSRVVAPVADWIRRDMIDQGIR